jgi:hypothetical protein
MKTISITISNSVFEGSGTTLIKGRYTWKQQMSNSSSIAVPRCEKKAKIAQFVSKKQKIYFS